MPNLLQNGLDWLERKLNSDCSSPIEYRQGGEQANAQTVNAVFGKTDVEVGADEGFAVQTFVWDFLILAADLGFEPSTGDTIIINGVTYEAMPLGDEKCWRWTSTTRTTYRIHTKEIA